MRLIGGDEDFPPGFLNLLCQTVMNGLRGEQADPSVMMLRVIPTEKALGEAAAVLDAAKAVWKIRAVLERFERIRYMVRTEQ
jgi:hypothetical protein